MKTCTIFNAKASAGEELRSQLETLSRQSDSAMVAVDAQRPEELIEELKRSRCERLIVAGGDGTVSRLFNVLGPSLYDLELAIVPAGTGNDLARSLGLPLESIDQAWQIATEGAATAIDVARFSNGESSYYINTAAGGFGGKVASDVADEDKRRWGAYAYWLTAASILSEMQEHHITLEMDDRTADLKVYGLGVANGRFVGGGFPLAPTAYLNDGALTIVAVPVLPTMELLAAGLNFTVNQEKHDERIHTFQSSRVQIHSEPAILFSVDGEPTREIDATFEVLPAAARVVCGPEAPAIMSNDRR